MCDRKTKGGKAKVKEVRYRDYIEKYGSGILFTRHSSAAR